MCWWGVDYPAVNGGARIAARGKRRERRWEAGFHFRAIDIARLSANSTLMQCDDVSVFVMELLRIRSQESAEVVCDGVERAVCIVALVVQKIYFLTLFSGRGVRV